MNYFFLSRTELFYGIIEDEIKTVLNCLQSHERKYKSKEIIHRAGTYIKEIGLVEEGSVNIVEYQYWGNKSILGNIKKGDIFVYLMRPYRASKCKLTWLPTRIARS